MEIKLSVGDKINIPENCKAIIEDDLIIIEGKQEEFKDGDILHSIYDGIMIIFKAFGKNGEMSSHYDNDRLNISEWWLIASFRHATEEEKQAFFDELKADGLCWNAETKTIERIRKRVKKGEKFLYINSLGNVESTEDWGEDSCDDDSYNSGNYYPLEEREQAEKDAKEIKAIYQRRFKV